MERHLGGRFGTTFNQKAAYGIYKYIGKTEETHFIDDKVITNVPFVYAVEAVTTSGISKRSEVTIDMEAKPKKRKWKRWAEVPLQ